MRRARRAANFANHANHGSWNSRHSPLVGVRQRKVAVGVNAVEMKISALDRLDEVLRLHDLEETLARRRLGEQQRMGLDETKWRQGRTGIRWE